MEFGVDEIVVEYRGLNVIFLLRGIFEVFTFFRVIQIYLQNMKKKVNDAAGLGVTTLRPHWTGTLTGQVVNREYDSMLPGNV